MPAATGSDDFEYAGNRLGLPADGPASVAGWGRRLVALFVDWIIASLAASAVVRKPLWSTGNDLTVAQLAVFGLMTALLVGFAGATIGHRLLGLRVIRVAPGRKPLTTGGPVGLLPGLVRAVLICLLIPPVVYDRDRRGLHDKAAGTAVVVR